jgi:peptidoglycan L-alanyl-D-glutamate endopeptidase CwlK
VTKLDGVHPDLAWRIERIMMAMQYLGWELMVTAGVRSTLDQQRLYAQGRTAPGAIVTNADGVKKRSKHQLQPDGYGHAVDVCFVVGGRPTWDDHLPWRLYGEMGIALGLTWGGTFTGLVDRPHMEWP